MRMSARPCLCRSRPRPTGTRSKPSILSAACSACCREVIGMAQATVKCHLCGRSFQKPAHEVRPAQLSAARPMPANGTLAAWRNTTAPRTPSIKPGGVVSYPEESAGRSCPAKGPGRLTGNFTAGTSTAWRRRPCWAGPCGPARSFITGTATSSTTIPMNLEVLPSQAEHTKTQPRDPQGRWCK